MQGSCVSYLAVSWALGRCVSLNCIKWCKPTWSANNGSQVWWVPDGELGVIHVQFYTIVVVRQSIASSSYYVFWKLSNLWPALKTTNIISLKLKTELRVPGASLANSMFGQNLWICCQLRLARSANKFRIRQKKCGQTNEKIVFFQLIFQELLTEAGAACEEGLVEVLVVDGDSFHQGWGEGQHLCLKQKKKLLFEPKIWFFKAS